MTSTDSLNTLATVECPSSERLKHYLSGWLSDGEAEQLEQHLHSCEHCESAMRQLDVHQETLLQSLQATMVQEPGLLPASTSLAQNGSPDSSPADPSKGGSAVIDDALSKARRLLDTPLEAENDPKPVAWHPTHRDFGCYELLRPLGRGGMGAVYLARHRQLGKQVAIKLLPVMSAEDSDVRTRFDREIRVVGRLNHPSIVAATDAGEIEGTQFLVMEYVPGLDLSRLARLMGRLPVAEACELIRQASLGLSCAHAEGVVHRDIKPSNLMLDDLGRIRILDFGLAQWTVWDEASVDLTTVGQLMGTLDYMAPEQAEAIGAVDYRADLYALGATLFRLLCGRAPLAAAPNQSPLEKLRLLSHHQPPKLSTLCPEAPEELVKLVASLLSRNPSDRPASAAHVAEQLAPFAEGAKLVELLQQAKEKAAASPELLKRTALYEPPFPGSAVPMSPPEPAASSSGRFKTLRRLLLAASLPLMIIAGILIKLELNKGQLIIESDVDNVNVKVLKDGKPVDGIQVNHGTTSTRLYADNYEITIDGPSDGLIIDHDKFTLKNGETVVARIKQVPRMEKEAGSDLATNDMPKESAVVKSNSEPPAVNTKSPVASSVEPPAGAGQLKTQIQTLLQSNNEAELIKLFEKWRQLPSPPLEPELAQTLIDRLPGFPVSMKIGSRSKHNYYLDFYAFNFVAKSCPERFFAMWRQSFETAESESWRLRLIERLHHGMSGKIVETEGRNQDVSAFEAWFMDYIKASPAPNPEKEMFVPLIASQVLGTADTFSQNPKLVTAVENSPYIKPDWWLVPLSRNPSQSLADRKRFSAALDVLEDQHCSTADLAKACIVIAGEEEKEVQLNEGGDQFTLNENPSLEKLIDGLLQQQLRRLIVLPDEDLWKMINLSERFRSPLNVYELQLYSSVEGNYRSLPVAELLDLILVLREDVTVDADLKAFFEKCKTGRTKVKLSGRDVRRWLATTKVEWGTFNVLSYNGTDTRDSRTSQVCSDQLWGVGSKPTEADWLQFCLFYHKALAPYGNEFEAAQKKTEQPRPSPAAPLYNGQPLEHWLDMIGRERSVEGLKVAFEGCDALVSKENSPIITETLLKFLPVLDGELKVLDKEANRYWTLDYEAARLLWKANPGAQFFTMWVKERSESKDEKWSQRLDQYATHGYISSSDEVQPFINWARFVLAPKKTGTVDPGAVQSSADLLRGMLNNDKLRADETFVSTATAILTESPYLSDEWWLSQPLLYRGRQGDRELFPAAYQQNVVRKAIVALQSETDSALVVQACMILANGVKLDREETDKVLQAVQKRIEQTVHTPEFFVTVHVPAAFSSFAVSALDTKDALKIGTIQLSTRTSMVQFIPVTDTSLAMQLLNVIASLDGRTTCEPQCRMVLEATRGVFDRVRVNYGKRTERPAVPAVRFRGTTNRLPIQLLWPELTRTDSDPSQGKTSDWIDSRVKDIWGDHSPTQSDWLQLLILNHPAMEDVVATELEKSDEQK